MTAEDYRDSLGIPRNRLKPKLSDRSESSNSVLLIGSMSLRALRPRRVRNHLIRCFRVSSALQILIQRKII